MKFFIRSIFSIRTKFEDVSLEKVPKVCVMMSIGWMNVSIHFPPRSDLIFQAGWKMTADMIYILVCSECIKNVKFTEFS